MVLPDRGPTILGARPRYSIADDLNVTCMSGPSKPPSFLQWFVNDKENYTKYLLFPILLCAVVILSFERARRSVLFLSYPSIEVSVARCQSDTVSLRSNVRDPYSRKELYLLPKEHALFTE
ncbi:uncharacterized protein CEXT_334561 [Caerostris extrusa]|uniref:CD80-like immunoglobulin C2-set domain-containing protein n=1 Tax=Caerostris extrusa TaxID=172846 RepID=A0AAV4T1Z3_CAEEX|nr:uncharacterized protein CEXT_334561 [Caerostris extrusa]